MDVAIVGGGCAGLYCAWRLLRQKPDLRVHLFEKQERLGGRLMSVKLPGIDFRRAELGGMRYIPTQQKIVAALLNQLSQELGKERAEAFKTEPFDYPDRFRFLRSRRFAVAEPPTSVYDIADSELLSSPLDIARKAIWFALQELDLESCPSSVATGDQKAKLEAKLEAIRKIDYPKKNDFDEHLTNDSFLASEWRILQSYGHIMGRPLYDIGFWNLLQHYVTSDEFLYIHDALGYESLVANWNAAQAIRIVLADYRRGNAGEGDSPTHFYCTISAGMDQLPQSLAVLVQESGGVIQKGVHVDGIKLVEAEGKRVFEITVSRNEWARPLSYFAKKVILAIPKRQLGALRLQGFSEEETKSFEQMREGVTSHAAFKLFLTFAKPWWKEHHSTDPDDSAPLHYNWDNGRATTDFPIRQIYYMSKGSGPALIMASYSDDHYVDFWAPLVNDPRKEAYVCRIRKSSPLDKDLEVLGRYLATDQLITKARRQLARIHGYLDESRKIDEQRVPQADVAVVQEWKEAWHFWNAHTRPWEEAKKIMKPFFNADLYVCGEAYSTEQGWVEGALKSAELALAGMGLETPVWLKEAKLPDEYLTS